MSPERFAANAARLLRLLAEQRRAAQCPVLGRQQRRQAYLRAAANAMDEPC